MMLPKLDQCKMAAILAATAVRKKPCASTRRHTSRRRREQAEMGEKGTKEAAQEDSDPRSSRQESRDSQERPQSRSRGRGCS